MSFSSSVFEPRVIVNILKGLEENKAARDRFQAQWRANVDKRMKSWLSKSDNKETPLFQLEWEAEVVEYVDYLRSKLFVNGNASTRTKDTPRLLGSAIPFMGPRFTPPTFFHYMRRDATPAIRPEIAYVAPINIVHPVYHAAELSTCPQCNSSSILWDGWTATGARSVYGYSANERALGYQLRCKDCKKNETHDEGGYCLATTNPLFWAKWPQWRIPRDIPYFFKKSAVTQELFNLITEFRPCSTSSGVAECIKQLHLKEYRQRMNDYLLYFDSARQHGFKRNNLQAFSSPTDKNGYNDFYITHDMVTDVYMEFITTVRKAESVEYCMTRMAKSISLDNTFKSAGKATIIDKDGNRLNPLKGGVLSAINEEGEGLSWRYCMSASPAETRELLLDVGKRHDAMGVPRPVSVIVDNCCQVRRYICEGLGNEVVVNLDVYHFVIRYGAGIYNGTRNKHRLHVLRDLREAIIKTPATGKAPATYWTKTEQETRLIAAYEKWVANGDVWSEAAPKIHLDQLKHVRRGCLARPREDIAMDGSRIEGSHKGWNSIQRAQPSGIEVYTALAHDFVHRRNIRIGSSRVKNKRTINAHEFVASTYSSHHTHLVNHTAKRFNSLYDKEPASSKKNLKAYPTLPHVKVEEPIGLVESAHSVTFGGLMDIKDEVSDTELAILEDIDAEVDEMDYTSFMKSLGVKESLFHTRMPRNSSKILPEGSVTRPGILSQPSTSPQKRKECAQDTTDTTQCLMDDVVPDPKRRRFAGSPSPGTAALSLSFSSPQVRSPPGSTSPTPEPHNSESESAMVFIDYTPTEMVVDTDVSLPSTSLAANQDQDNVPHAFFRFQTPHEDSFTKPTVSRSIPSKFQPTCDVTRPVLPTSRLDMLRRPLQLPLILHDKGLTRSQLLFSIGTSVDPRALRIFGDNEFYLFMDMRAEFQWISFSMTTSKWATATMTYNTRLEIHGREQHFSVVKKNPRALMDKLNEIEPKISERLAKQSFISTKSNTDTFWRRHCYSVSALVETVTSGDKTRKAATCKRCKVMKYPGDKSLNHRLHYCADGVASTPKTAGVGMELPPWPQPQGIFKEGKLFDPAMFLTTLRDLYEKTVEHAARNLSTPIEYSLEDYAFSRMLLDSRVDKKHRPDGHIYFRLYNLESIGMSCESFIAEFDGSRYLRIDCL